MEAFVRSSGLARAPGRGVRRWRAYVCASAITCLTLMSAAPAMATITPATAVAAGNEHTCALTSGGGVDCWGHNKAGELGDGTETTSSTPVEVKGVGGSGTLSRVVAITAGSSLGGDYTCALTSAGTVDCWGANGRDELGDESVHKSSTPVEVVGVGGSGTLSGVVAIAAGSEHTCALTSLGGVDCWGENIEGDLGDGRTTESSGPVEVEGVGGPGTLSGVKAIAAGDQTSCALVSGGGVDCWGLNQSGELGDGTFSGPETCTAISTPCSRTPVEVKGVGGSGALSGIEAIAAGGGQTCALTSVGGVDCWGDNKAGELGDGTEANSSTPVPVKGVGGSGALSGVKAIAAGSYNFPGEHTCALMSGGAVDCWGYNHAGQLGDGTEMSSATPAPVEGAGGSGTLSGVKAVAAGGEHTCALTSGGGVDCWGANFDGQLGDGSTLESSTPAPVEGAGGSGTLSGVKAVAAGGEHTCALTSGGGVDCWGASKYGDYGEYGQLGDGSTANSSTPVAVKGVGGSGTLSGVKAIAAGSEHTCALISGGGVDCWGYNDFGQLGDGTAHSGTESSTPVEVEGVGGSGTLSGVVAIASGGAYTCALTNRGGVDCWGFDWYGELGDGSTTESSTPVEVEGVGGSGRLSGVVAIAAGGSQACALTSGGGVDCWGENEFGELGDGFGGLGCTSPYEPCSRTPVEVEGVGGSGTLSGVKAIAAGGAYTCALTGGGAIDCWGANGAGELGDGTETTSPTPVEVEGVGGSGTLSGVEAIAAGGRRTCAVSSVGGADCWGANEHGQLGDGTTTDRSTPVEVKGAEGSGTLSGVEAIAAGGESTCALTSGGGVDCWGLNDFGQLGDGSTTESSMPVAVPEFGGTSSTTTTTTTTAATSSTTTITSAPSTSSTPTITTAASAATRGNAQAGRQAIVTGGSAALELNCAGPGACKGTVKLIARTNETRTVGRHRKRRVVKRTRKVVIGTASFSLAEGASETLHVPLSARGERLLRKAGEKGLQVSLVGSAIQAHSLVLKAPKS